MTLNRMIFLGIALALAVALAPELADAQSWRYKPEPTPAERTGPRLLFMIALPAIGFGLGWFFSAHAKGIRQYIWYGLIVLFAIIAIWGGVAWGWVATLFVGAVGFCLAFGFWSAGKSLPTTHGSSRWATTADLEEKRSLAKTACVLVSSMTAQKNKPSLTKGTAIF